MTALTRVPGTQGGWTFTPEEIHDMRRFVVQHAGHEPLAQGDVGESSARWIETHVAGGVAAFLAKRKDLR